MSDRTKHVVPESGRGNVSWGDDPACVRDGVENYDWLEMRVTYVIQSTRHAPSSL